MPIIVTFKGKKKQQHITSRSIHKETLGAANNTDRCNLSCASKHRHKTGTIGKNMFVIFWFKRGLNLQVDSKYSQYKEDTGKKL